MPTKNLDDIAAVFVKSIDEDKYMPISLIDTLDLEASEESPFDNLIEFGRNLERNGLHEIIDVIFHEPATVVKWKDGTKTVVKCGENDIFDPEKGLALCIVKKALGNTGNYYEVLKPWLKIYEDYKNFLNANEKNEKE